MDFWSKHESVWDRLARETRPIVLYGMGDGADKILNVMTARGIRVSAVFASDEFVRGHSFRGFPVERLLDVTERLGDDIVIVIAFASQRPEVLEKMYALDAAYDVVAPDVPVAGEALFTPAFAEAHADEIRRAFSLLADEQSRRVFEDIIAYKITGKLSFLRNSETEKREAFETILRPGIRERFVDLGAYNGDTIRELLSYTGGCYEFITALEPDRKNLKKLKKYVEESLGDAVRIVHAGAWDCDEEQTFAVRAGRNSAIAAQGVQVPMRSVDNVLAGEPCSMLKLDVEGAERRALLGAQETIRRYLPRLNVAAYHRSEDIFELVLLVHDLSPSYSIYLRRHPYVPAWDINLYARAD